VNAAELAWAVDAIRPHVIALALIVARLVPVVFLCPLLGGSHAPTHVKLGVALALGGFLHFAAGVGAQLQPLDALTLAGLVGRELSFGVALGLVAALPFDAARMGGRFIDLFRGSSAEAALPMAGSRETVSGDALHHLVLALLATGAAGPILLGALARSFGLVALGGAGTSEALAWEVADLVAGALALGLAIGAPVAGLSLAIDAFLGLASRAAPQMNLQEVGTPVKVLAGGAALWLSVGLLADRLVASATEHGGALATLTHLAAG
jgi:flagellar biosynthesis protein FliR